MLDRGSLNEDVPLPDRVWVPIANHMALTKLVQASTTMVTLTGPMMLKPKSPPALLNVFAFGFHNTAGTPNGDSQPPVPGR